MQLLRYTTSKVKAAPSFQDEIIALIRALGLHRPDTTPCRQPVSVAEAQALLELSQGNGISQTDLANRLQLEKSTVSRIASGLVDKGWLRRERDSQDSRLLRLSLTALGTRIAMNLSASRRAKFTRVFEAIPASQRAKVVDALAVLSEAFREA
jgi:DNA-binding MarR family transcriptional regulator